MRGFIPSCNNKMSIWKIPLTKNTKCEKEPSFSAFEWFQRIQHWPWQPHERVITMKGASPLCLLLSENPGLHTPQDRAQPCKEESTGCSFPPPITSSLTHHSLQHCQPAFLTQLCRHLSANVFPLFLASFLSFVSAAFMLLTACFLTQGTDFFNGTDFSSYTTSAATATCTDLHALSWHCLPRVPHQHVSAVDAWLLS